MSATIRKRKKRFWAVIFAFILICVQVVPSRTSAEKYSLKLDSSNKQTFGTDMLKEGDTLLFDVETFTSDQPATATIYYCDVNGASLGEVVCSLASNGETSATVETYSSFSGQSIPLEQFQGWKVTEIVGSGEKTLYQLRLTAVAYGKSNINYQLDGGTNASANPSFYYEGKETVFLLDAEKENYTFEGWYLDQSYTNKVESLSTSTTGDITLYAKFSPKNYSIIYETDGGEFVGNHPDTYTYGQGVSDLGTVKKTGYTFEGWYSDASFTTKITSISTTSASDLTLFAKFTVIMKPGEGSLTVEDIYYGETLRPIAASTTNGTDHVTITYKKKQDPDSSYTTTVPTQAGEYVAKAVFPQTTFYHEVVVTDEFAIKKKPGEGSVLVADVAYGTLPEPVITSSTNKIEDVTILYKKMNASEDSYTSDKPSEIGKYTAKAIFAETEEYLEVIVTTDFSIDYLETPQRPYLLEGKTGENQYYTSDVTITPAEGYLIAENIDGSFQNELVITKSRAQSTIFLKKSDTGALTFGITIPEIKIDKIAPQIDDATSGETIYAEQVEVTVRDEHLSKVFVNEKAVAFENEEAVLTLSSEKGEKTYRIVSQDEAGNQTRCQITVAAKWMESKTIPAGTVNLLSKYAYQLGSGKWKINGDNTVYSGNSTFYVNQDGTYSFSCIQ